MGTERTELMTFKVSTNMSLNDLKVVCQARDHKIIFDEIKSLGGSDLGMNPVEATLAALGACQCIVAKLFAKIKDINLKSLRVELEGDMVTPDLQNIAEGKSNMHINQIRSRFYINVDDSDDKIKNFVSFIENNCPVADLLKNPTQMIPEVVLEKS